MLLCYVVVLFCCGWFGLSLDFLPPEPPPPPLPLSWTPSARPPKISLFFFLSATHFSFFVSLCVSSRRILVVFWKAKTLKSARLGSQAVV